MVKLKKLIQTRLHNPPKIYGNCFPTTIACLMGLDSAEDVTQFQEYYERFEDGIDWETRLHNWLNERKWNWFIIKDHKEGKKYKYYLVTGNTKRSKDVLHVCIYANGKLVHDPHPDQSGLTTERYFEVIQSNEIKTA